MFMSWMVCVCHDPSLSETPNMLDDNANNNANNNKKGANGMLWNRGVGHRIII